MNIQRVLKFTASAVTIPIGYSVSGNLDYSGAIICLFLWIIIRQVGVRDELTDYVHVSFIISHVTATCCRYNIFLN